MVQLEDLIDDLGGLGKYQILLTLCITAHLVPTGWSMLFMSFAGQIPDFYCLHNSYVVTNSTVHSNDSLNVCDVNGYKCSSFAYVITAPNVVSEWDLVCDKEWIKRAIISSQMAGVFVGAALSGQLGDSFGRKKVLFVCQVEHAIINFIAAMSNSWIMFIACRFFTGIPIGAILVIALSYPVEFCPIKWRNLIILFPAFTFGICAFALGTYLLPSWYLLHVACGILCVLSLFGICFVPESLRWLATQNKIQQAQSVVKQIAYWNGRPVPENSIYVLEQIAAHEEISREDRGRYTYMDLFRTWHSAKISVISFFLWFAMSIGYYGISFGVSSLSGNIHVNLFLMSVLETPTSMTTMYFMNAYGRRKSTAAFCSIGLLCMVTCIAVEVFATNSLHGILVNILLTTSKLAVNCAWAVITMWSAELYPTVIRSLGFAFAQVGARVGGTVSPFIINLDSMKFPSYGSLVAVVVGCIVLCFFVPETKGKVLQDTFELPRKSSSVREKNMRKENVEHLRRLTEFAVVNDSPEVTQDDKEWGTR